MHSYLSIFLTTPFSASTSTRSPSRKILVAISVPIRQGIPSSLLTISPSPSLRQPLRVTAAEQDGSRQPGRKEERLDVLGLADVPIVLMESFHFFVVGGALVRYAQGTIDSLWGCVFIIAAPPRSFALGAKSRNAKSFREGQPPPHIDVKHDSIARELIVPFPALSL